jgi:hypothetical protein
MVRQEGFQHFQSLAAAVGSGHLIASAGEHRSQQLDDDRIVVDDQDEVIGYFLFLLHVFIVVENKPKVKMTGGADLPVLGNFLMMQWDAPGEGQHWEMRAVAIELASEAEA